jgi:hypothetical protein
VLADKAYGSRGNRSYLRRRGIRCTTPEKADQVRNGKNKGRAGPVVGGWQDAAVEVGGPPEYWHAA